MSVCLRHQTCLGSEKRKSLLSYEKQEDQQAANILTAEVRRTFDRRQKNFWQQAEHLQKPLPCSTYLAIGAPESSFFLRHRHRHRRHLRQPSVALLVRLPFLPSATSDNQLQEASLTPFNGRVKSGILSQIIEFFIDLAEYSG